MRKGVFPMIKVGVIGLGNIAQKAYLPVDSQLQDRFEWYLVSRQAEKLQHLQKKYGFQHGTTRMDDLFEENVQAVFIHTATSTHYAIIKKFLQHGVHVYVDKPISENLAEVKELYQIAAEQHVLLTCGFNRRFAPLHQAFGQLGTPHLVRATKTRVMENQSPQFAVYDLMIHVIDLVQFLMGSSKVEYVDGRLREQDGQLVWAEVELTNGDASGVAQIDLRAGANTEVAEVVSDHGVARVENLQTLTHDHDGQRTIQSTPDWQKMLVTRGFAPLIEAFLRAVENDGPNPVAPASVIKSHTLCDRLIQSMKVIK